jgi:hypothetical protein
LRRWSCVVVGDPEGLVQGAFVVATVVAGPHEGNHRKAVLGQQIDATELDGIDTQFVCCQIHGPFEQLGGLRPPRSSEGPHGGRIRQCHRDLVLDGRDLVDTLGHESRRAHGEGASESRVRASVGDDTKSHPGDPGVVVEAKLHIVDLASTMRHCHHVLRPRLHPGHGAPKRARCGGDHQVLGSNSGLGPEASADVRRDHSNRIDI